MPMLPCKSRDMLSTLSLGQAAIAFKCVNLEKKLEYDRHDITRAPGFQDGSKHMSPNEVSSWNWTFRWLHKYAFSISKSRPMRIPESQIFISAENVYGLRRSSNNSGNSMPRRVHPIIRSSKAPCSDIHPDAVK
ncbi:Bgh-specific hypothetical protein [Blumeria hordei DH14]|uniref:Uncharacterized protein n=1 Tax=Blumeria graminis f. sp. hordei (strain DH14) TaxID=546991 RepID=N1JL62_BLUG1|nr:Bgh-specific hypothetical protein [Blumeria hordei DH14]